MGGISSLVAHLVVTQRDGHQYSRQMRPETQKTPSVQSAGGGRMVPSTVVGGSKARGHRGGFRQGRWQWRSDVEQLEMTRGKSFSVNVSRNGCLYAVLTRM